MPLILLTLAALVVSIAAFLVASTALRQAAVEAERKFRDRLVSLIAANDEFGAKLLRGVVDGDSPVLDCVRTWQREKASIGVAVGPGKAPHDWGTADLEAQAAFERDEALALRRGRIRTGWVAAQGTILAAATVAGLVLHQADNPGTVHLSSASGSVGVRQ